MIDTLLNLMFRCAHRRLTRPLTPVSTKGVPHSDTYVVCLDCGKQFHYDLTEMRIGKPVDHSHDASVLPKHVPRPSSTKVKYAMLAAVPVAMVIGAMLKTKKPGAPAGDRGDGNSVPPPKKGTEGPPNQ